MRSARFVKLACSVFHLQNPEILLVGLFLVIGLTLPFRESVSIAEGLGEEGIHLQQVDQHGVVFVLDVPPAELRDVNIRGLVYQRLSVAGWAETGEPGYPQLPVRTVLVAVPPYAQLSLDVQPEDVTILPGRYRPVPATRLSVNPLKAFPMPRISGNGFIVDELAPAHYAQVEEYPVTWAVLDPPIWIRQQRVAAVHLTPFRYRSADGRIRVARHLRVKLRFDGPIAPSPRGRAVDPYAPSLAEYLLNSGMADRWRLPFRRPESGMPMVGSTTWRPAGHKLFVDHDGLYRLTFTDTLDAGVDVNADPHTFKLFNGGREVAIYVTGEADGSFGPQDEIVFYGQQAHTRLTDRNVYWLVTGGGNGLRMATREGSDSSAAPLATGFPDTLSIEENHVYSSLTPRDRSHDHWFWDSVLAYGAPAVRTYPFTLTQLSEEPFTATLHGVLAGVTSLPAYPDHHTRVYLNGSLLDDQSWDGQTEYVFTGTLPSQALIAGRNTISVALPLEDGLPYDYVFVDRFALTYRRPFRVTGDVLRFASPGSGRWRYRITGLSTPDVVLLDVSDPLRPVRIVSPTVQAGPTYTLTFEDSGLTRHRFLVVGRNRLGKPAAIVPDEPSDLRSPTNGADEIIITHDDFYTSVLPLRDYRAAQGMRVQLVRVQDVYDEFNYGLPDPQAIRDFLAYAYEHWTPPAPAYVLLVGDGTLDPKNYMNTGARDFIPPYLAPADPWINETAADNRYVDVHGDDHFPDMYLGRLPADSVGQATAMVDKIVAYEQHPLDERTGRRVLFVADNADSSGDFAAFSDRIADVLPHGYLPQRVYYGDTHTTVGETRDAIITGINDGRILVQYAGHSAYDAWADEAIFGVSDLPLLENTAVWPIMLPMTCYDGYYLFPGVASLGESIVREARKGAVASWSPTGLGVDTGHDWLAKGFMSALLGGKVDRLGPATMSGLLNLLSGTPNFHELIDTYVLFGDPALHVSRPYCNSLGVSDTNCDCRVDAVDVQAVAARWHSQRGQADYLSREDVNADGQIDLTDVMRVASDWGKTCSP